MRKKKGVEEIDETEASWNESHEEIKGDGRKWCLDVP